MGMLMLISVFGVALLAVMGVLSLFSLSLLSVPRFSFPPLSVCPSVRPTRLSRPRTVMLGCGWGREVVMTDGDLVG